MNDKSKKQYMSNSRIDNSIRYIPIDGTKFPVAPYGSKQKININISLAYKNDDNVSISKSVSFFEKIVADAVYSLYEEEREVFTINDVARLVYGEGTDPSLKQTEDLKKAIDKLRHIDVTIDASEEDSKKSLKYINYLLPVKSVEATFGSAAVTAFKFMDQPPIFAYAKAHNQVVIVDRIWLDTASCFRDTEEIVKIRYYIVHRILTMKNSNNNVRSNVISYDRIDDDGTRKGLYALADLNMDSFSNIRRKRMEINKIVQKLLEYYKSKRLIEDFQFVKENQKIVGVKINA